MDAVLEKIENNHDIADLFNRCLSKKKDHIESLRAIHEQFDRVAPNKAPEPIGKKPRGGFRPSRDTGFGTLSKHLKSRGIKSNVKETWQKFP